MRLGRKVGPQGQYLGQVVDPNPRELVDAALDHYWHPNRDGVEQAPEDFQRELTLISDDVKVVRPPANAPLAYKRAWLVWYRKASVTHHLSPGWLMLREWRTASGEPLPLDARVFSYLYSVSARVFGNAVRYWDHCVAEMNREKAAREKIHQQGNHDRMRDYMDFTKIKNIGTGNKYALHHDSVVPSRAQRNWLAERRQRMIPGEVRESEKRQREMTA